MSPVNRTKQADKARQTRRRITGAAHDLFTEHGYGATTLQDVADRAGVAVQTIYFTFGNKRSLLKEVVDTSIAGDDQPVATLDRAWFRDALAAADAPALLRQLIQGTRQIIARVAPMMDVLRTAAATDPEIARLWPQDADPRYAVHLAAASALVGKPGARPGVPAEHAADLLYGLLSPELYRLYVRDRGWTADSWEHWTYQTLCSQLCDG
ncbi:MAG: TetR/AcrR family transcriptional regulator [Nocardiopsaceae bacterium]|nr:TetR/AcrR family transcriptional regulator [Nocardiopsaceae bacterium]